MASLGFEHGPIGSFSLPRSAVISTRVDQPNAVTVVLSAPSTSAIARYLSRALPLTGYRVTAATPSATAIIFTGYGWEGSFTGTAQTAAIALRR